MQFKAPELKRDQLPAEYAGPGEIVIESPEQLERAVQAIKWLRSAIAEVDEALTLQTMPLQEQAKRVKVVDADVGLVAFETLEQQISEAVESYVRKHRRTLFDDKCRTLKLKAGEVSIRDTPLAITYKLTKAKMAARLAEHFEIIGRIIDYAKRLGCRPWLKLEPVLDVTSIKAAYEAGELTKEDLAEHGLKAETSMVVKIKPYA
jgi:hypothetical protein